MLLQVTQRNHNGFSFLHLRVAVGRTAAVSSSFFFWWVANFYNPSVVVTEYALMQTVDNLCISSMTNEICRSLWRGTLETYRGALVIKRKALESCNPVPVYHMSRLALLCIYVDKVCFLRITWICGPKARTFLLVLSLTSNSLF
jgi:hypothetical protein